MSVQVEHKDQHIRTLCKTLEESENQHKEAMSRHFIMMDNMMSNQDVRMQGLYRKWKKTSKSSFKISPIASSVSVTA